MDISTVTSADGTTRTVTLTGEVDLDCVERLRDAFTQAIEPREITAVVIDLGPTGFLDSSGIGALVFGHHLAVQHHTSFTVVNATGLVRHVLELTGALSLLQPGGADAPTFDQDTAHS